MATVYFHINPNPTQENILNSALVDYDSSRVIKAGVSITDFIKRVKDRNQESETFFGMNGIKKNGKRSISLFNIRPKLKNGKKTMATVELSAEGKQLFADLNIYTLSEERQQALIDAVNQKQLRYHMTNPEPGEGKCRIICSDLDDYFKIVDFVSDIDALVAKSSGGARIATQLYEMNEVDENQFLATASTYKIAIDTKNQRLLNNFRVLLAADDIDHIITKGWSDEYKTLCHDDEKKEKSRREHVVPCVRIHNRVIEMFQSGSTVEEVADFIENHLVIVMISDIERVRVDITLGLQNDMPQNWNWGDDIYARLDKADIKWKMI